MSMRRTVRPAVRTTSLCCLLSAALAVPALAPPAAATSMVAARQVTPALAPGVTCERAGPIRHAAAGLDFGGKELDRPDPAGTRRAITALLADGPLP
ncbi:hypothetical protein [Streptomyces sp. NPDC002671]